MTPEIVDVTPSTVIAAVGTVADHTGIPALIPRLLDPVRAYIRGNEITAFGHNVILYRDHGRELTGGVQVPEGSAEPPAPLILASTPGGRAAHVQHAVAEPSWEVYGDWDEDESKLVTDIYVSIA